MAHLVEVDELTSAYIRARADSTHQTPAQIIGALVRKEIRDAGGALRPSDARPAS